MTRDGIRCASELELDHSSCNVDVCELLTNGSESSNKRKGAQLFLTHIQLPSDGHLPFPRVSYYLLRYPNMKRPSTVTKKPVDYEGGKAKDGNPLSCGGMTVECDSSGIDLSFRTVEDSVDRHWST
jgi:hypothetical protein